MSGRRHDRDAIDVRYARLTDHDQYGTANLVDGHQHRRATDDRSRDEGRGEEADQRRS